MNVHCQPNLSYLTYVKLGMCGLKGSVENPGVSEESPKVFGDVVWVAAVCRSALLEFFVFFFWPDNIKVNVGSLSEAQLYSYFTTTNGHFILY